MERESATVHLLYFFAQYPQTQNDISLEKQREFGNTGGVHAVVANAKHMGDHRRQVPCVTCVGIDIAHR